MGEISHATATLTNSIIGVTVLAMPYCFFQCGFILASLLLLLVGLATVKSSEMLLACALATKRGSFEFLAHHVYGRSGKLVVEVSMIGLSLGTLVAFHIIVGDLCPQVVLAAVGLPEGDATPGLRRYVMSAFAAGVILPLSLMRDPSSLSKISFVSLAFYGIFLLHLAIMTLAAKVSILENSNLRNPYEAPFNWFRPRGILYSLPIMGLAFSCQTQLFLLYDSLINPTIGVVKRIVTISVASSCIFYILVGTIGYITCNAFHPVILGDLTAMYPSTPACNLVRLLLVLSVAVSFPVITYPCRVSVFSLLYVRHSAGVCTPDLPSSVGSGGGIGPFIPEAKFRAITVAIVAGTLVGGILLPNVEFVLAITGALTGSIVCYILPASFFLATFKTAGRTAATAILVVGLIALCVSTFAVLAQHGGGGSSSVSQQHRQHHQLSKRQPLPAAAADSAAQLKNSPVPVLVPARPTDASAAEPLIPRLASDNGSLSSVTRSPATAPSAIKAAATPPVPAHSNGLAAAATAAVVAAESTMKLPADSSASSLQSLLLSSAATTAAQQQPATASSRPQEVGGGGGGAT